MDDSYDKNEFDQYLFPSHEVTLCTMYSHVDSKPPENLLATPPTTPNVVLPSPTSPTSDNGDSQVCNSVIKRNSSMTTAAAHTSLILATQQCNQQSTNHLTTIDTLVPDLTLVTPPTTPTIPCFVMTTNAYAKFLDLVENNSNKISSQVLC